MNQRVNQFMEILQLVALEPAEQAAIFPPFVEVPDEVVVLFGDHFDIMYREEREMVFVGESKALLMRLQEIFEEMNGKSYFYSQSAFEEHPQWQASRKIARDILRIMNIPRHQPVLYWMSYVPS